MKYFRFTLPLLFCFPLIACSQDWVAMMHDPKANLHDVQKAFYKWHETHKGESAQRSEKESVKGKEEGEDGNYELFKRWEWFMAPRTYPTGIRPDMGVIEKEYNEFLAKQNSTESQNTHRVQSPGGWTYAGSVNVPSNGDAGRLNRIRINPSNSNILYACAPSGGLWESTNGGASWFSKTDRLADLATSDVAIDPTNTNIMYLATGDGDGIGGGENTPSTVGVLKSTDGGNTWKPTSLYYTLQVSALSSMTVNELLISPAHHNIVFAATSFGLYYTPNSGISWYMVLSGGIKDIAFAPTDPSVMYATTSNGQFYRSSDSGYAFTHITLPSSTGAGRMAVAVSAASMNYVYVLADKSSDYSFLGVWQSTDEGQTFTLQSTSPNILSEDPAGFNPGGQGWYDLAFAASPTNANELIVGGCNIWRSTNGGSTWRLNASQTGFGAPYVHADVHHLIYLNGSTYFAGCDGGIFKTSNSGGNWTDLSNGLEIAEQYSIGLSASSSTLWLTGWQDNGTNEAKAGSWSEVEGGDGMVCFIDHANNNNMYCEMYDGQFELSTNGDVGPFNSIAINTTEAFSWVTPWLQDPKNAPTIFGGAENVWKSTNRGNTWSPISTWGQTGNTVLSIAVAPSSDQYIYASNYSGIQGTKNGGTSWTNISAGLPVGSAQITCITVDSANPLRVWVTFSGYSSGNKVYQSVNGGTTWTNISTGLPNLPVNCIAYDQRAKADAMYVGTDMGVYYRDTANTGGQWVSYNTGLPNVMVADLKIYAPGKILRAATYGRGTWQISTYTPSASKPVAHFEAFPTTVCANVSVQLTDSSANLPTSWNWTLTGGTPATSNAQNPIVTYTVAGTYPVKLVATNSNGSDSLTVNNYITVNPIPPMPTIVQNGYQLSVSPIYQYYQWYFQNVLIPDVEAPSWFCGHTGNYKVIVTDSTGCSTSATYFVSVLSGVNDLSSGKDLLVYPNPTSSNVEVVFNVPEEGDFEIAICDILGQSLYSDKVHLSGSSYTRSIDMSQYQKGIYFLSISGNGNRIVKKITVL